ncbi:MAG: lipoyl(octanoyl) transferase LipB [Actinomycetales bacterium]|nr:MAG: lipoyl(octanoyl) transferase LipB [Actinomycetales bacterium]
MYAENSKLGVKTNPILVEHLGLIEYQKAWDYQRKIQAGVIEGSLPNTLILLEHPSVYTAGRRTETHERPLDGTSVIDVDRGGKITWHGEGQLIGYPIIKLRNRNNVVGFVREVETALIEACTELGLTTTRYCERSGVWIRDAKGDRKIAAIGIRVAKGVTMHGFALNINPDMSAYDHISPCGLADTGVTSLAKELGRDITISEVLPVVERNLLLALERIAE